MVWFKEILKQTGYKNDRYDQFGDIDSIDRNMLRNKQQINIRY